MRPRHLPVSIAMLLAATGCTTQTGPDGWQVKPSHSGQQLVQGSIRG